MWIKSSVKLFSYKNKLLQKTVHMLLTDFLCKSEMTQRYILQFTDILNYSLKLINSVEIT